MFFFPLKLKLGVIGLIIAGATLHAGETKYFFNSFPGNQDMVLLLPAAYHGEAFRNSMTAIELDSVKVNDLEIPVDVVPIAGRPDKRVMNTGQGTVLHRFSRSFLECWEDADSKAEQTNKVRRFVLPSLYRKIEIKYKIRFPNGMTSDMCIVTYSENDDKTHVFSMP